VEGSHDHIQDRNEEQVVEAGSHGYKQVALGSQDYREKEAVEPVDEPASSQEYKGGQVGCHKDHEVDCRPSLKKIHVSAGSIRACRQKEAPDPRDRISLLILCIILLGRVAGEKSVVGRNLILACR